jgi:hypothetical protein
MTEFRKKKLEREQRVEFVYMVVFSVIIAVLGFYFCIWATGEYYRLLGVVLP